MADYIDREEPLQKAKFVHGRWDDLYVSKSEILAMPSVNVQPVVYCKDCVNNYGTEHSPMCDFMDAHLYPNSYCSYGEMNQKKLEE